MAKNGRKSSLFGVVRAGLQLAKVTGPELHDTHSGTLLQRSRKSRRSDLNEDWVPIGSRDWHVYIPTLDQFSVNIAYMDQISKGECISPMDPMGFGLLLVAYWSLSFLLIGNRFR